MKSLLLLLAIFAMATAAPVGPTGPCPDAKVDAILRGEMDPAQCCSYGRCKGDVVVAVGL